MASPQDSLNNRPPIVLIESDPDLASLETLILGEGGYRIELLPRSADPVDFVAQAQPAAVVAHLGPESPYRLELVDRFRVDPRTRAIPLVVIAMSEQLAAQAGAGPNVRGIVVAPYDIDALEAAVSRALGNPSPAVALPNAGRPVPAYVRAAADAMTVHARSIVLDTIRTILTTSLYRAYFPDLTVGLVDDLATMVGAIIHGFGRDLPPPSVFENPKIARCIEHHVALRRRQGLDPTLTIYEYQALMNTLNQLLVRLISDGTLTAADAFAASRQLQLYVDALIRIVVDKFGTGSKHTGGRSTIEPPAPP
jgi:DNA-binding response OmpR family regulator